VNSDLIKLATIFHVFFHVQRTTTLRLQAFLSITIIDWVLIVDEAFSLKKVFLAALLAPTFRSILPWRAARSLVRVVLDVDLVVLLKVLLVVVWFYVLLESCN
jgi:hypothetical protein